MRKGLTSLGIRSTGGSRQEYPRLVAGRQHWAEVDKLKAQADDLAALLDHTGGSAEKHAKYMRDTSVPAMAGLQETGDAIEVLTPHEIWRLPTYREMLFVK